MNLNELEAKYAELGAEIEKLKAESKEWPQVGDCYYSLNIDGVIINNYWDQNDFDKMRIAIGNCFRTKKEAEAELDTRKVIAELRRCEGAELFEAGKEQRYIYCRFTNNSVYHAYTLPCTAGFTNIYFKSPEACEAAIAKVGHERLVKAARWLSMREC